MSKCQKLTEEECNKLEECIFTKGKRKYCRTKKNKTSTTKTSTTPSIHNEPEYISIQYYSLKKNRSQHLI